MTKPQISLINPINPSLLSYRAVWVCLCLMSIPISNAFALTHDEKKSMGIALTESVNCLRESADLGAPDNGIVGITTLDKQQKMKQLLTNGIALSHKVSDEFLAWLCPGLKESYREHCIKGAIIYLDGLNENNVQKQYLGIKQSEPWLIFYDKYGPIIGERLYNYCR
jgi:hypothetical protein